MIFYNILTIFHNILTIFHNFTIFRNTFEKDLQDGHSLLSKWVCLHEQTSRTPEMKFFILTFWGNIFPFSNSWNVPYFCA